MPLPSGSSYPLAYDDDTTLLGDPVDQQSFTLLTSIGAGDTTFRVTSPIDAINIPCQLVWATGEICWAIAKDNLARQFTVERGASVPHTAGEVVRLALTSLYIKQIKRVLLAIENTLGLSPQGAFANIAARIASIASFNSSHTHDGASGGPRIPPASVSPQGAASGLDADKLDGLEGSYFLQKGRLVASGGTTRTIASDAITVDPGNGFAYYLVDTEGAAPTDDLVTINGGASGDVVILLAANTARIPILKNTGNIQSASDIALSATSGIVLRYNGTVWQAIGGIGTGGMDLPKASSTLDLTSSYQSLVAAPSSGVRKLVSIEMINTDATVGTMFYWKIVKSAVDYFVFSRTLAAGFGDGFGLGFPIYLDTTESVQAKVADTCAGARAFANYVDVVGGVTEFINFTGTSFSDVLIVPAGKTYRVEGWAVVNTSTTSEDVTVQAVDGLGNIKASWVRTLAPGESWFHGCSLDGLVMSAGWKLQVSHGTVDKTGSALASAKEV